MSDLPDITQTRPGRIVDALRRSIITGEIEPGNWLREETLAQRFGVSRTPIREACHHLANEDLLVRVPNRGFRACRLDLRELDNVYPVLVSMELLTINSLAEPIGPLVAELERLNFDTSRPPTDASAFYDIDYAWHARLVQASQNEVLIDLHRKLASRIARYIHVYWGIPTQVSRSAGEHQHMANALARNDIQLASALMRAHRNQGLERIRALMADVPQSLDQN